MHRTNPPPGSISILEMEEDSLGVFAHGDTAREREILWGCGGCESPPYTEFFVHLSLSAKKKFATDFPTCAIFQRSPFSGNPPPEKETAGRLRRWENQWKITQELIEISSKSMSVHTVSTL